MGAGGNLGISKSCALKKEGCFKHIHVIIFILYKVEGRGCDCLPLLVIS